MTTLQSAFSVTPAHREAPQPPTLTLAADAAPPAPPQRRHPAAVEPRAEADAMLHAAHHEPLTYAPAPAPARPWWWFAGGMGVGLASACILAMALLEWVYTQPFDGRMMYLSRLGKLVYHVAFTLAGVSAVCAIIIGTVWTCCQILERARIERGQ